MFDLNAILSRVAVGTREAGNRVVMPEVDDLRVAESCARLRAEGMIEPVPLAEPSRAQLEALQANRPMKEALARRMLERPLYRAAAMVAAGEADALVAGASVPTRRVIEAASIAIGFSEGVETPSSFFLMLVPDGRALVFADCAVNVAPDARMLADIARASAASAQALLGHARVAMLSFSTFASGAGGEVDRVAEAVAMLDALDVVGPVQADAALSPRVAALKNAGAGDANVLVFPSLEAANIGYKLVQELAGAQALGPFLQGFRRPVCDLSRGATVDDIVTAAKLTLALA